MRRFCRDDREKPCSPFLFVAVRNLLQSLLPRNGNLLAGDVLAVGELPVLDILSCQPENVIAPHALGIDREQEDVAGEDGRLS